MPTINSIIDPWRGLPGLLGDAVQTGYNRLLELGPEARNAGNWPQPPDLSDAIQHSRGLLTGPINVPKLTSEQEGLLASTAVDMANPAGSLLPFLHGLGIIAGKGAKTADINMLTKAQEMKAAGVPADDIYAQTKWWLDHPDGQPRFEIDDSQSVGIDSSQFGWGNRMDLEAGNSLSGRVEEFLKHDELGKAYPSFMSYGDHGKAEIMMGINPTMKGGSFGDGRITAGMEGNTVNKSTVLHELQHGIQGKEGFAVGGSPEKFRKIGLGQAVQADKNVKSMERVRPLLEYLNSKGITDISGLNGKNLERARAFYGDDAIVTLDTATNGTYTRKALDDAISAQKSNMDWAGSQQFAEDQYKRLAGEAEARLVQNRRDLNPKQRMQYPFYKPNDVYGYDVPLEDQIVKTNSGVMKQQVPIAGGDKVTLYSGTNNEPIEQITPYGEILRNRGGENYFGGIFASGEDIASSHGDRLMRFDIDEKSMLDHDTFNREAFYSENQPKWYSEAKKMVQEHKGESLSEDELDEFMELLAENKYVQDGVDMGESRLAEILGYDDIGEQSWDIQGLRGELARRMGYGAVSMKDEHGITHLLLNSPSVKIQADNLPKN
jgi:hypothetical protein